MVQHILGLITWYHHGYVHESVGVLMAVGCPTLFGIPHGVVTTGI